ncbi:hypothetical protein SDC9_174320 [bioreactor metagenome]|uniref:DUF3006 domain-containing protein n=1 Tax=bioreactor metagenome TaxID=1076179 RepID=A0A645GSB5_9ZZZZ|nr:DUF3006 domain-containing protein [Lutispora sp.]MEA4960434.1 DUF3006 domain-containing protein [Lutispora sp.]
MRYIIIDRFEGDYAVCEDENKEIVSIERARMPAEAKEGDVLVIHEGEICLDIDETIKRKEHIRRLMDDLWVTETTESH